ncbi:unnamed protein product [Alternaria alternata]
MPQVIDEYISGYDDVEENSTSAAVWGIDYVYLGKTVKDRNASSQFDPTTTLSWTMPSKQNTSLVVSMDTVSISDAAAWKPSSKDPASSSVEMNIDSAVPQIWLPEEACTLFETAFGLTWDDSSKLYLINDTTHARLLSESPEVQASQPFQHYFSPSPGKSAWGLFDARPRWEAIPTIKQNYTAITNLGLKPWEKRELNLMQLQVRTRQ